MYLGATVSGRVCLVKLLFRKSDVIKHTPVATLLSIESAISSPSILRYHSLGSSWEAMSVAARPSRALCLRHSKDA